LLNMNPNYLTARYSRGSILLDRGEYYKAAEDFSKVVELDHRNLNGYYKLGECYYKAGNYPAAIEAYQKIQELNFADVMPLVYITKSYVKMNDLKNAKKTYEKFEKSADLPTKSKLHSDTEWQQMKMKLE
jgi:tetratricopeptide (TPR) repeat protein